MNEETASEAGSVVEKDHDTVGENTTPPHLAPGLYISNQIYFQMQKQCTQQTCNAFRWCSKAYSTYSCRVLQFHLSVKKLTIRYYLSYFRYWERSIFSVAH